MNAGPENCHSIRYAHTPHTGEDETTNPSVTPSIPHTRRRLVSKRDQILGDFSSFSIFLYSFHVQQRAPAAGRICPLPPSSAAA